MSHARIDDGEVSEHALVHAVHEHPVGARQARLLVDELFVKVAAVAGGRLRAQRLLASGRVMR